MADESQPEQPKKRRVVKKKPERTLQDILKGKPVDMDFSNLKLPPEAAEKLAKSNQQLREGLARYLANRAAEREREQEEADARERIDQELIDQAIIWLQNKWGEIECPYCKHIEWQVSPPMALSVSGDQAMSPAFPVMCGNCGHTTFINAIRAGLFPESEEE
jgi:RNase P subunit RPR2